MESRQQREKERESDREREGVAEGGTAASSARTTIDNWIFAVSNPIYFVLNTKTCLPLLPAWECVCDSVTSVCVCVCYKVSCFRVRFNVI